MVSLSIILLIGTILFLFAIGYTIFGAYEGVAAVKAGRTVSDDRICWSLGQALSFGLATALFLGTVNFFAVLILSYVWLIFFSKVHDKFILWKCPDAEFEPVHFP